MKNSRVVLLGLCLAATAAYAAKPQIQWNSAYDFSSIQSFAWKQSPQAVSLEEEDPFMHAHIVNAIQFQLTSGGLTEVDSNPDVLVTYYGSTETRTQLQSNSYGYGWGGYGGAGWGYYGYGGGPVSTTTRVVEYERGTLVIDIIDAASNELIWRGVAEELTVSSKPDKNQRTITKAIEKMVRQSQKLRQRAQS